MRTRTCAVVVLGWIVSRGALGGDVTFERFVVDGQGPRDPWAKIVGDFNGDGRADIAIGGRSGPLVWYEQPSWEKREIARGGYRTVDGEAGDVDADGDVDIVMGGVLWYENPGRGEGAWLSHRIGDHEAHDVELVDLDGDARLDVVTRNQSGFGHRDGDRIIIWMQQSKGEWARIQLRAEHGEGLAHGDVDGDGDADLVVGAQWFENPGEPAGRWVRRVYSSSWTQADVKVAVADLNGDGHLDIVLTPAEPKGGRGRVVWFAGPGDADAARKTEWRQRTIERGVESVVHALGLADLDGDGAVDVVTAEMHQGKDPDEVVVFLNRDRGSRWERRVVASTGSHNIVLADVDGDGTVDIVGANHGGDHQMIEVWRNRRGSK